MNRLTPASLEIRAIVSVAISCTSVNEKLRVSWSLESRLMTTSERCTFSVRYVLRRTYSFPNSFLVPNVKRDEIDHTKVSHCF